MVRTVVGDETQVEAQVDSLFLSRRSVQVRFLFSFFSLGYSHCEAHHYELVFWRRVIASSSVMLV